MPARRGGTTGIAPVATASAWVTRSIDGVGPDPPERSERGDDRVEVRAEPGDLASREPGDREEVAVRRRPDRLDEVPDVEAAGPEGAVLQHGERAEPGCERSAARPRRAARDGSPARRRPLEQRPPARAEHVLRGARLEGLPPGARDALARARRRPRAVARRRRAPAGRRAGRASRPTPSVRSSRAAGVSAVITGPRAGERLEHLVRDHARRLLARPEDAERAAGGAVRLRQLLVGDPRHVLDVGGPPVEQLGELAVADDPERDLGHERCGGEDRLEAVERDQLPDEEDVERLRRVPARAGRAARRRPRARRRPAPRAARTPAGRTRRAPRCRRRRGRLPGRRRCRPRGGSPRRASGAGSGRGRRRACRGATRAG